MSGLAADLHLFVMAGGSGTRFWPKSTSQRPKQLLSFGGGAEGASLLSLTLRRFAGWVPGPQQFVLTTQSLAAAVSQDSPAAGILAEPQGRNTAPCIYWAAREVAARDPRGVMLVMPSDHYIPRLPDFKATVERAAEWARTHDDLVTLGVKPSRPETGYGYLKLGAPLPASVGHAVQAFVEKPNLERAREFFASGQYLWNGGMFVWRADVILRAFDAAMPEMKQAWESAQGHIEVAYPKMTATSIDFGVMEKAPNVVTFALDCGWDDLGSWPSLEGIADALAARQEGGVVTAGQVIAVESTGNIVDAPGRRVALLGVEDLIVVQQGEAILIARKDRAQDLKLVVERVKKEWPDLA